MALFDFLLSFLFKKYKRLSFDIVLTKPSADEYSGYVVQMPRIEASGNTPEEVIKGIKEKLSVWSKVNKSKYKISSIIYKPNLIPHSISVSSSFK